MGGEFSGPLAVIGLGRMGSTLAQVLLGADRSVVVYNRTASRAEPLRELGATVASSLAQALDASSVALISLSDYAAANELFFGSNPSDLRGKTLIQLSSGTPKEARAWFEACAQAGGQTLTGAILGYPMHIGTPVAQLLISGPEDLFERSRDVLAALGSPMRVSENPGGASALDCAVLAHSMFSIAALAQGIEICRSGSVDPTSFVAIVNAFLAPMAEVNNSILRAVVTGDYANPQASMDTWGATAGHVADIVADHHMPPVLSDALVALFARARAAGLGDMDIGAFAEVLRAP